MYPYDFIDFIEYVKSVIRMCKKSVIRLTKVNAEIIMIATRKFIQKAFAM